MQKTSFLFLLLACAIALLGAYNSLFPAPASTVFIRFFGLSGFLLLCVSLMLGPLAMLWPPAFRQLLEPRRAIGIACFVFVLFHVLLLLSLRAGFDIPVFLELSHSFITIPATLILFALAVTSSDFAVRAMGHVMWKYVQRFNYLAFVLSFAHFILYSNGLFVNVRDMTFVNLSEVALVVLGAITVLLQIAGFIAKSKTIAEKGAGAAETPAEPMKS